MTENENGKEIPEVIKKETLKEALKENSNASDISKAETVKSDDIPPVAYPDMLTVEPSPHIKHKDTARTLMINVLIALTPAVIYSAFAFGYRAILLTTLSVISCIFFEWGYEKITKRQNTVSDCSAALTGVLLAMNVPSTLPFWMIIIGAAFAIIIVKQLFGGLGKNIVNPALAARVFMFLSWPSYMSAYPKLDATASATPLAFLKNGDVSGIGSADILRMFMGVSKSGVIGEISAMLLLAGGIFLIVRKVITWHIPTAYIGTVALITFLFPRGGAPRLTFMLAELLAGGLILGAVYMATDYATSPVTKKGRIIYGIICGLITVFIRYFGAYNEGVSFSILIANLLVYYIDKYTRPRIFGSGKKAQKYLASVSDANGNKGGDGK